ncbi:MAG: hypothetical protein GYB66_16675, partial [Chloroflexi bacterium]|nr:hypothetical protein [Chloroflexota bacterium]
GQRHPRLPGPPAPAWRATPHPLSSGAAAAPAGATVLHEVAHMYQDEYAAAGFSPGTWWIEGNATFFELNQQYDYEQRVRNIASSGRLPTLLKGSGPGASGSGPDGIGRYGYDVGYTFWKWVAVNYGLDAHREIIEKVGTGIDRNGVLEEVLGMPIEDIERQWRIWLGASAEPPTLIPTPTFRFPPTVTPFQYPTSPSSE